METKFSKCELIKLIQDKVKQSTAQLNSITESSSVQELEDVARSLGVNLENEEPGEDFDGQMMRSALFMDCMVHARQLQKQIEKSIDATYSNVPASTIKIRLGNVFSDVYTILEAGIGHSVREAVDTGIE